MLNRHGLRTGLPPKKGNYDKVQLCAQAVCLEEMLNIEVPEGALFYGKTRRRQDVIMHPFVGEKVSIGLLFHMQALLLARHLRGDLEGYPPFIWK